MDRVIGSVRWLVVAGWVLFLGSLLMPALRVQVPEALGIEVNFDETFAGWQAAFTALNAVVDLGDGSGAVFTCAAGVGNILLLLSPLCCACRRRLPGYLVGAFMIVAVLSGLFVVSQFGAHAVRAGCIAWVLSYLLVVTGLLGRSRRPAPAVA